MDDDRIRVDDTLAIPRAEVTYRAVRSGGPGGQHVNTSSTRVELSWNVRESPTLDDAQRARLLERLANRIDGRGVLRMVESRSRSQHRNRETVTERFAKTLARALEVETPRKRTRPPRRAKEDRLKEKKQRSETKRLRGPVTGDE